MADVSPLAGVVIVVGVATGCVLLTGTALVEARFACPALAGTALIGFALNEVSNGAGKRAVDGFADLTDGSACASAAGSGVIAARQPFELGSTFGVMVAALAIVVAGAVIGEAAVEEAAGCRS